VYPQILVWLSSYLRAEDLVNAFSHKISLLRFALQSSSLLIAGAVARFFEKVISLKSARYRFERRTRSLKAEVRFASVLAHTIHTTNTIRTCEPCPTSSIQAWGEEELQLLLAASPPRPWLVGGDPRYTKEFHVRSWVAGSSDNQQRDETQMKLQALSSPPPASTNVDVQVKDEFVLVSRRNKHRRLSNAWR
jgi:hypothetical protein